MSNSSLATYTKLSPNNSGKRNHSIDTITIHCTAGNKDNTAKQIVSLTRFITYDPKSGASCNYAVGGDGSVALSVDEANRSWCTSSGTSSTSTLPKPPSEQGIHRKRRRRPDTNSFIKV